MHFCVWFRLIIGFMIATCCLYAYNFAKRVKSDGKFIIFTPQYLCCVLFLYLPINIYCAHITSPLFFTSVFTHLNSERDHFECAAEEKEKMYNKINLKPLTQWVRKKCRCQSTPQKISEFGDKSEKLRIINGFMGFLLLLTHFKLFISYN